MSGMTDLDLDALAKHEGAAQQGHQSGSRLACPRCIAEQWIKQRALLILARLRAAEQEQDCAICVERGILPSNAPTAVDLIKRLLKWAEALHQRLTWQTGDGNRLANLLRELVRCASADVATHATAAEHTRHGYANRERFAKDALALALNLLEQKAAQDEALKRIRHVEVCCGCGKQTESHECTCRPGSARMLLPVPEPQSVADGWKDACMAANRHAHGAELKVESLLRWLQDLRRQTGFMCARCRYDLIPARGGTGVGGFLHAHDASGQCENSRVVYYTPGLEPLDENVRSRYMRDAPFSMTAKSLHQVAVHLGYGPRDVQQAASVVAHQLAEPSRASGDALCEACGSTYANHALATEPEHLSHDGQPFLHRLCNGRMVKL